MSTAFGSSLELLNTDKTEDSLTKALARHAKGWVGAE